MDRAVMHSAQRDSEFVARFAAERAWLHVPKMMGVRWLAATDETWLLGDVAQMLTVTISTRRSNREDALVDTAGPIICGMGSLRLLLRRHL
jgi:hypothetical protein